MPDQSVVEELVEKGARARCAQSDEEWTGRWPERFRAEAAEILDAVFPGWREGKLQFGLLAPNGNVHGPISNRVTAESAAFTNDRLVSRWVGPWVPVEERTDG